MFVRVGPLPYSVPAVSGAVSYNWSTTVPGAIVSPSGTSCSISFPASIPAGSTVCVTAVSACGNASIQRCKGIANGIPNMPGNISGPANGQCAQSGVSYSITPVSQATSYLWTATGGATVSGPANLSAVSFNFPSSFTTCTLSVVAVKQLRLQRGAHACSERNTRHSPDPSPATRAYAWEL